MAVASFWAPLVLDLVVLTVYTADANDDALGEVATVDGAEYLLTRHDTIDDLDFDALHEDFKAWINVLAAEHVEYVAVRAG